MLASQVLDMVTAPKTRTCSNLLTLVSCATLAVPHSSHNFQQLITGPPAGQFHPVHRLCA